MWFNNQLLLSMSSFFLFTTEGVFVIEPKARTHEKSTKETVFDHIWRKSKDFPLVNKHNCVESIIHKMELFSKINPIPSTSSSAAFCVAWETNSFDMVTDNMLTLYMKTAAEVENIHPVFRLVLEVKSRKFGSFCGTDGEQNISKGVSSTFFF